MAQVPPIPEPQDAPHPNPHHAYQGPPTPTAQREGEKLAARCSPLPSQGGGVGGCRGTRAGAYLAFREALTLLAVLLVVGGMAAAFTWPWLPQPPIGGEHLATYAPLRDGDARLSLRSGGDGEVQGWQAQNTRLIPGLRVATDLRKAFADAFLEALRRPGEDVVPEGELEQRLAALTIVETRTYELGADGKVEETWQYFVRDDLGDRFLGIHYPQVDRDIIVDPPILVLPADADGRRDRQLQRDAGRRAVHLGRPAPLRRPVRRRGRPLRRLPPVRVGRLPHAPDRDHPDALAGLVLRRDRLGRSPTTGAGWHAQAAHGLARRRARDWPSGRRSRRPSRPWTSSRPRPSPTAGG